MPRCRRSTSNCLGQATWPSEAGSCASETKSPWVASVAPSPQITDRRPASGAERPAHIEMSRAGSLSAPTHAHENSQPAGHSGRETALGGEAGLPKGQAGPGHQANDSLSTGNTQRDDRSVCESRGETGPESQPEARPTPHPAPTAGGAVVQSRTPTPSAPARQRWLRVPGKAQRRC